MVELFQQGSLRTVIKFIFGVVRTLNLLIWKQWLHGFG